MLILCPHWIFYTFMNTLMYVMYINPMKFNVFFKSPHYSTWASFFGVFCANHHTVLRNPRYAYEITISLMFAESKTSPSFDVAGTKKILVSATSNLGFHGSI